MNASRLRHWMPGLVFLVVSAGISTAITVIKANDWRWPTWGVWGLVNLLNGVLQILQQRRPRREDGLGSKNLLQPVLVKHANPTIFGIEVVGRRGRLTKYFERDARAHLDQALNASKARGGRIVLVGEPGSGRSRLVYEVLQNRESFQQRPMFKLNSPADFQRLPSPAGNAVLWLDDLRVFLDDVGDAWPELRRKLGPIVLIGTVFPEHKSDLISSPLSGVARHHAQAWDDWQVVNVRTILSPREVNRARETNDKRILDAWNASRTTGHGLTQTLAFAAELKRRWQDATGADRTLLRAAVDAKRVGGQAPLSVTFLGAAAKGYFTEAEETRIERDHGWLTEAIRSVTTPVESAQVAPLKPVQQDVLAVEDYLYQIGVEERKGCNPPLSLWVACSKHVTNREDLYAIGSNAYSRGFDEQAIAIWAEGHRRGGERSTLALAKLLIDQKRHQEAVDLLEPIAGKNREACQQLADELIAESRRQRSVDEPARKRLLEKAERLWRDQDDELARLEQAAVLEELNRSDDALDLLQQAVVDGAVGAEARFALLLQRLGKEDLLERFWRGRGSSGFAQLAQIWSEKGRIDEAEDILLAAVRLSDDRTEDARVQLANLYLHTARRARAEEELRAGVNAGESASRLRLVALLNDDGKPEDARKLLMDAAPYDLKARRDLIGILLDGKKWSEAEEYCRIAVAAGDPDARSRLCDALNNNGRKPDAIEVWENAISAGEQSAWYQEAEWLHSSQYDDEAKQVLDEAMRSGISDGRIRELFDQLTFGFNPSVASKGLMPPMRDRCP
jgi:tetratricopeptide (TPR) repeat protein